MEKYIFKKGSSDNQKIIAALIHFILRSFEAKAKMIIENTDGGVYPVVNKMLRSSDVAYTITDVYSGMNDICVNTILQFYLNHHTHITADDAIWIGNETEVVIDIVDGVEKSFTFTSKNILDGSPVQRKLVARQ